MGLTISMNSQNIWQSSYATFNKWRILIAKLSLDIDVDKMSSLDGVHSWQPYLDHPLFPLLSHNGTNGLIAWESCKPIAESLLAIIPKISDEEFSLRTLEFANACLMAFEEKQDLEFC